MFAPSKVFPQNENTAKDYKKRVPDDFLFAIKVPKSITLTHYYKKNNKEHFVQNPHFLSIKLSNDFLKTIKPLKDNIGCLLCQFEYLNKQKMSSQLTLQNQFKDFIEKIEDAAPLAGIEIRNPNYLNKSFFDFLASLKIIPVLLVGYYMPDIVETCSKFKDHLKSKVIFRLHGSDRSGIEKMSQENWNNIYIDRKAELIKLSIILNEFLN